MKITERNEIKITNRENLKSTAVNIIGHGNYFFYDLEIWIVNGKNRNGEVKAVCLRNGSNRVLPPDRMVGMVKNIEVLYSHVEE